MSDNGRYTYTDIKSGRKFVIEPIGDDRNNWGDYDPVTKKFTGNYGEKHRGSIIKLYKKCYKIIKNNIK